MCTSKVVVNVCLTKQKAKTKNVFVDIVYSVLTEKEFW